MADESEPEFRVTISGDVSDGHRDAIHTAVSVMVRNGPGMQLVEGSTATGPATY
jgi:hypothetical protein